MTELKWYRIFDNMATAEATVALQSVKLLKLGKRRICLARTANDEWHAVNDMCPHMFGSLSMGHVNFYNEVVCPLHGYRYSLETGEECDRLTEEVERYLIDARADGLFIGIHEAKAPETTTE